MFINLLPGTTRLKIQFRSMFRCYAVAWGLAGLGVGAYIALQVSQLWQAQHELALLEQRCQPVYALERQITRDGQQLRLVETQLQTLDQLKPSNHFLDLLGILVQATRAGNGGVHIQRLALLSGQTLVSTSNAAGGPKPAASQPSTSTLSLSGLAADDATLTQFVSALREAGVFEQVDLKSSSQVAGEGQSTRQYQLECRYQDLP